MRQTRYTNPAALANIRGGKDYPGICGTASFYPLTDGVIVSVKVQGLPTEQGHCSGNIFALHIHEGTACSGKDFSDSGTHFDLGHLPHPCHTGDLPPLFAGHGKAFAEFWTDRFAIRDIVGRTIVIHEHSDDFQTQPSGNAGKKIACGKILRCCCR